MHLSILPSSAILPPYFFVFSCRKMPSDSPLSLCIVDPGSQTAHGDFTGTLIECVMGRRLEEEVSNQEADEAQKGCDLDRHTARGGLLCA